MDKTLTRENRPMVEKITLMFIVILYLSCAPDDMPNNIVAVLANQNTLNPPVEKFEVPLWGFRFERAVINKDTFTYVYNKRKNTKFFLCSSIGYGTATYHSSSDNSRKTNGSWIWCKEPEGKQASPTYVEGDIIVSTFKLPEDVERDQK
jgi:hypothetical protein